MISLCAENQMGPLSCFDTILACDGHQALAHVLHYAFVLPIRRAVKNLNCCQNIFSYSWMRYYAMDYVYEISGPTYLIGGLVVGGFTISLSFYITKAYV